MPKYPNSKIATPRPEVGKEAVSEWGDIDLQSQVSNK